MAEFEIDREDLNNRKKLRKHVMKRNSNQRRRKWEGEEGRKPPNMKSGRANV